MIDHYYTPKGKAALCSVCGEPMPEGETMFKFHGYSGPCPKPPLPMTQNTVTELEAEVKRLKALHHDIYEIYAGPEGFPCSTASEGYLCGLVCKMAALAAEGKS